MAASFVHLHVHSYYSLMRGVNSPEALCRRAVETGMKYLALTDTNGLYGLIPFLDAARRSRIRPVIGAFIQKHQEEAVILARTPKGYELLSELISRRHLQSDFSLQRDFPENQKDVVVISSDIELLKVLRLRAECWVEVVPGSAGRRAMQAARELGLPPVASNRVYFASAEEHSFHRLLRAIDCNRLLSTLPEGETEHPESWLKPPERMRDHFSHCPEAVTNSVRLARTCCADWWQTRTVFPNYLDCAKDHFALLLHRCREGIRRRYGHSNATVEKRLWEELQLIREKGYVDYFLVVADIVHRRPIHCGRGSAAASLVSYLLGVTHVDPIRHRLVFSRFLNPQRRDHPDIDVDFPWDERDDLLAEIRRSYGSQRFAMVANHVGFGGRAAVREVAKVYGIPATRIKEVTRRLSGWTHPAGIRDRVDRHPRFRGFPLDLPWPEILKLAARLESIPRHLAVHCGGIILVPDQVSRYVPVQKSPKGVPVIQWEKDQVEAAGLVKIDLLGNRSLAVIRDTLKAVTRNTGRHLDYAALNPLDDPATLDLLSRGDTMGVFYVESPAMRQLQKKTGRGDFDHLVIHSSIIRPAANRYIREYIRRLHGTPYRPLHPRLESLLEETYGILVYQEQVVQAAMNLAGFDWAQADALRKVLSKKSREQISDYRRRFFAGCARNGVAQEVAADVWEMFTSFAGYSFCKPHSASYALVSFKSAYLKAHYPAEFMAAVISNGGGYYTRFAYLSEARRMGLTVVGPDINESAWDYEGKGSTIRVGLQQLQGIREKTVRNILQERKRNGPFMSLENLANRVSLTVSEGIVLAKSGALDCLMGKGDSSGEMADHAYNVANRPQLLWWIMARLHDDDKRREAQFCLPMPRGLVVNRRIPPLPSLPPEEKWRQEEESLGFVLSVHPLKRFEKALGNHRFPVVNAADLPRYVGRTVWVRGWPVTRKEVLTREGEAMEFVSFEDETAIYEAVFFPKIFRRFCQQVEGVRPYLLQGSVEAEFGAVNIVVQNLKQVASPMPVKHPVASLPPAVHETGCHG